jgi:hypothetical protein
MFVVVWIYDCDNATVLILFWSDLVMKNGSGFW